MLVDLDQTCVEKISHTIHIYYIYLHLVVFYGKVIGSILIGKYTSPIDPVGVLPSPEARSKV